MAHMTHSSSKEGQAEDDSEDESLPRRPRKSIKATSNPDLKGTPSRRHTRLQPTPDSPSDLPYLHAQNSEFQTPPSYKRIVQNPSPPASPMSHDSTEGKDEPFTPFGRHTMFVDLASFKVYSTISYDAEQDSYQCTPMTQGLVPESLPMRFKLPNIDKFAILGHTWLQ
jgi:hypothetical protein